jgi:hypothetical protein
MSQQDVWRPSGESSEQLKTEDIEEDFQVDEKRSGDQCWGSVLAQSMGKQRLFLIYAP